MITTILITAVLTVVLQKLIKKLYHNYHYNKMVAEIEKMDKIRDIVKDEIDIKLKEIIKE